MLQSWTVISQKPKLDIQHIGWLDLQYSAQTLEKDYHHHILVLAANYTNDTIIQEQLLFEVNPYFQVRVHMKKCTSNKFNFLSEFVQLLVSTQEAHYRGSSGWC